MDDTEIFGKLMTGTVGGSETIVAGIMLGFICRTGICGGGVIRLILIADCTWFIIGGLGGAIINVVEIWGFIIKGIIGGGDPTIDVSEIWGVTTNGIDGEDAIIFWVEILETAIVGICGSGVIRLLTGSWGIVILEGITIGAIIAPTAIIGVGIKINSCSNSA